MAITYRQILRMAAHRIRAIVGQTTADLETAYMTAPLTDVQIGSVNFTRSMIIDNMVSVVGTIVRSYASVPNHPLRAFNLSQTANITNRGVIPSVNSTGKPIVGVYGAIRDASTQKILTKQPVQLIESLLAGVTDGSVKGTYFYYDMVEGRLIHTVANAVIDVVTFDMATELAAVAAGNAPIPDALLDLAWTGLVSTLVVDDEFVGQAQAHRNYFDTEIARIVGGAASIAPAPQMTSNAAPAGS
jgi:hypothetical protein